MNRRGFLLGTVSTLGLRSPALADGVAVPGIPQIGQNGAAVSYPPSSGTVGPPVFTWQAQPSGPSGASETLSSFSIGAGSVQQALFISLANLQIAAALSSITVVTSPSGNTQTFTIDTTNNGLNITTAIAHCLITSASDTSAIITIHWSSNPFVSSIVSAWTAPASGFVSLTPTGANSFTSAGATVYSTTINTTANGFALAVAGNAVSTSQSVAFSGTQTYTVPSGYNNGSSFGLYQAVGDSHAITLATNTPATVTATFGITGAGAISAAAWR